MNGADEKIVFGRWIRVIEAKKTGTTLSGVSEQSSNYAENLPDSLANLLPAGVSGLPFLYESTGVETFFRDERDPEPRSRRVTDYQRFQWEEQKKPSPYSPRLWKRRDKPWPSGKAEDLRFRHRW